MTRLLHFVCRTAVKWQRAWDCVTFNSVVSHELNNVNSFDLFCVKILLAEACVYCSKHWTASDALSDDTDCYQSRVISIIIIIIIKRQSAEATNMS